MLAIASMLVAASASSASVSARTSTVAVTSISISGHGFGHGVGLSQWGAEERAKAGQSYGQILSFYYPHTQLEQAASSRVRVFLRDVARARFGSAAPFTLRDARGLRLRLPAGVYTVDGEGRVGARRLELPLLVLPGIAPISAGTGRYRGTITLERVGDRVRMINTLGLEQYLVGVVSSECPAYWPQDALRAQAVASRTYALSNLRPNADFDLFPDDRSQNYHGLEKSYRSSERAVVATRGQILTFGGSPIMAFFSASNGGFTSGSEGIWHGAALPYLVSRPDLYDAMSPERNWGPVRVDMARLRAAFPSLPATVSSIDVSRNDARRAVTVTFSGNGSTYEVAGSSFQQQLGLRSNYLSVTPIVGR